MTPLPTLRQLQYLSALAEHRHFGRAAAACFVTQSSLSAGIRELENLLRAPLVDRTKRSVTLTAAGRDAVDRARRILEETHDLARAAAAAGEPLAGELRLGVIPTVGPFLLPRMLPKLRRSYPKLRLYLKEDQTRRLVERLEAGALDVLLLALPYDVGGAETMELFEDRFHVACRADSPLGRLAQLTAKALEREPLLLLEDGHCLTEHALSVCRLPRRTEALGFEGTSLHTLVQMADGGLGVTFLPEMALEAGILGGTRLVARPLAGERAHRTVGLAWRRGTGRKAEFELLGRAIQKAREGARLRRAGALPEPSRGSSSTPPSDSPGRRSASDSAPHLG
jgi:LysR family hydrogen peroxide-inducible transcriptional activator